MAQALAPISEGQTANGERERESHTANSTPPFLPPLVPVSQASPVLTFLLLPVRLALAFSHPRQLVLVPSLVLLSRHFLSTRRCHESTECPSGSDSY